MLTYADDVVQRVLKALDDDGDFDPIGDLEPIEDYPLDPVARLTHMPGTPEPLTPINVTEPNKRVVIDNDPKTNEIGLGGSAGRSKGTGLGVSAGTSRARAGVGGKAGLKMTTGDFALKMLSRKGLEYEWGGTSKKTGFDCSGIMWRIMQNNGITIPRTSGEIYAHSKKISVEKAIKTRGAILWTDGHIAVSLGNGRTIEARGEDFGVVVADAHGRFKGGGLLPELAVGPTAHGARRRTNRRPNLGLRAVTHADPLNRLESLDSLTAAPLVFGSVMADLAAPPKTKKEADERLKPGGNISFVPAKYRDLFRAAAEKYGLTARLLASVAQVESGFNPKAVSSAGAQGMMQIMPLHGLQNPFNAKANIFKGAEILASYMQGLGLRKGLAVYNAGPSNYEAGLGYADKVLAIFRGDN